MNRSGAKGGIPAFGRIGIDLDNTVIDYAALIRAEVAALRLPGVSAEGDKRAVRDALRGVAGGEQQWTQLQARIYGDGIDGAVPFEGALAFIARARAAGIELAIVSHKTEFAAVDRDGRGPSLRDAARRWLGSHGVIGARGVDAESLYFEATRGEKAARIAQLGVDVFIDDLVEVFADPAFPRGVERWLFAPDATGPEEHTDRVFSSWHAINRAVFERNLVEEFDGR